MISLHGDSISSCFIPLCTFRRILALIALIESSIEVSIASPMHRYYLSGGWFSLYSFYRDYCRDDVVIVLHALPGLQLSTAIADYRLE